MKKWLQIIMSFIGSLLALWLAHAFNIFDYMTFIPKDKSYDVCIAVYFTLVEALVNILYSKVLDWREDKRIDVEVIMFSANEEPNIASRPIIRFNEMGIAEFSMKVSVKGKRSSINNNSIVLNSMRQVDFQIGRRGIGAKVDNDGNYIIEIDKICNNQDIINVEEIYKIVLQRSDMEDSSVIMISPKLIENRHNHIKFVANEANITLEVV